MKRIAPAICLVAGVLFLTPLYSWAVDFNDNPATRDRAKEDEAFYRYYMNNVTKMMSEIKMDPRTGRPIPPPNWGKAGSIPDWEKDPIGEMAAKARLKQSADAAPCCSAAATDSEKPGNGVLGPAGATGTNQKPEPEAADRQAGQYRRVATSSNKVVAKANKATLLANPQDLELLAAAYKAMAALWVPRKQEWDAEAYVLCKGSDEAIKFVQTDLGQVIGAVGPGEPPYLLQVVNDSAIAGGVDTTRLPAVILQTKAGKVIVYAGENLERRWQAISGPATK